MTNKKTLKRYRMDNSAIIYPMVTTPHAQSNYCLGVEFYEEIDENLLLQAINSALERFPFFKVRIRYGYARPYFEENPLPYKISQKPKHILSLLDYRANNGYVFYTYTEKNVLRMVFFHALCDANGGMEFLKTVTYLYLRLSGKEISDEKIRLGEPATEKETEDAFDKYFRKFPLLAGAKKMAGGYAFGVPEKRMKDVYRYNRVECRTEDVLRVSRSLSCTATVFVCALLSLAVYQNYGEGKDNIVLFVPVNYRKTFPSDTLYNFTGFARVIVPKTARTVEELCQAIQAEMAKQTTVEELQIKMSFSSLLSKTALRFFPYFFKKAISVIGRNIGKRPTQTMIVSNIGSVSFPETEDVRRFLFYLNCNDRTPENVGVLSYRGKFVVHFTRKLFTDKTDKTFFTLLSSYLPCIFSEE